MQKSGFDSDLSLFKMPQHSSNPYAPKLPDRPTTVGSMGSTRFEEGRGPTRLPGQKPKLSGQTPKPPGQLPKLPEQTPKLPGQQIAEEDARQRAKNISDIYEHIGNNKDNVDMAEYIDLYSAKH